MITNLNPWWVNPFAIQEDKKIKEFESKKYKYYSPLLNFEFKPNNLYSLRGPRQLGKTTIIKLLIRKLLLKEKINPLAVFFWSCEDIPDYEKLVELIQEYLDLKIEKNVETAYIFLDEISFVKDWQRGIKLLVDRGYLEKCCVILTGSNIIDLKTSLERLPGRRGPEAKDFFLYPLSFREFCSLLGFNPEINTFKDLLLYQNKLAGYFREYQQAGGFPLAINEWLTQKNSPVWLKEVFYNWVIGDIFRMGKSERVALQILSSLIRKQPSALSWDSLARDAEVKSHLTISSYLEALEQMFVLKINYWYDLERKMANPAKNKKIHFLDPFIYRVFAEMTKQESKPEVAFEDMACFHLFRAFSEVYYTSRKKEVDFLVFWGKQELGIEVKCQEKINPEDFESLAPFGRGILITKKHLESKQRQKKKYLALPLCCFAYLNQNELKLLLK